ncbi:MULTISPECIES: STAS domain-containing protein [unclassified Blastococcus]
MATDEGPVAHFHGDVDVALLDQFGGARQFAAQTVVAVDVGELGYIDSHGLSLLVRWAQARAGQGQPALIRGTTERFARVLEVSGLSDVFTCES